ncbi:hypothetical protein EB796_024955 [Bugula neritina]|uniref:Uncharacterized protein n=1 Tax=Bugula neritina TaxID=10212 RepID=A0A7J7IS74_BUGNE|nr:hypothetical protein EB796_024955 [Bugula neritina]
MFVCVFACVSVGLCVFVCVCVCVFLTIMRKALDAPTIICKLSNGELLSGLIVGAKAISVCLVVNNLEMVWLKVPSLLLLDSETKGCNF